MNIPNIIITLLAVLEATTTATDEDFAFDIPEGIDAQKHLPGSTQRTCADVKAIVGKVFRYEFPKDTFEIFFFKFEAKIDGMANLPSWILFDKTSGSFWGIPAFEDIGSYHVIIRGFLETGVQTQTSKEFTLSIEDELLNSQEECKSAEKRTVLKLGVAKELKSINPKQRIMSIVNIAKFFGLPECAFRIKSITHMDDIADSSVIMAGPGTMQTSRRKPLSDIILIIGCNGHIWENASSTVRYLKMQASDGTIAEVLALPLVGWQVTIENFDITRNKRDIEGSGDDLANSGDGDQYYNYEDYDYSVNEDYEETKSASPASTTTTTTISITTTTQPSTTSTTPPPSTDMEVTGMHPHRHHHGETQLPTTMITITTPKVKVISTTTTKEVKTSITTGNTLLVDNDDDERYDDYDDHFDAITVMPSISVNTESNIETTKAHMVTKLQTAKSDDYIIPETTQFVMSTVPDTSTVSTVSSESPQATTKSENLTTTTPISTMSYSVSSTETTIPTTTSILRNTTVMDTYITTELSHSTFEINETTQEEVKVVKQTTLRHVSSTPTPTIRITTESVIYEVKNFPPTLQNRLNKLAATAGKLFSFFVPNDTFSDIEDGTDLRLKFLDGEEGEVKKSLWCQFNPKTREVYGLPMEIDVSRWTFTIKAFDSEGASVVDTLEILVQHHKSKRAVNHEFSLYVQLERKWEFTHLIDWPLKILRALKEIHHLPNLTEITVRNVDYQSVPAVFTWTNDSLPKHICPKEDLENIFKMLTMNNEGDPTHTLIRLLAPELRVKKVAFKGLGICEPKPQIPITPPTNFSPILRNPVDHIDATVGKLLVYKVPDDTFYDPEDTDPRNLRMTLLTADRQPIPENNWLQFDEKNKEFYGVPLPNHVGSKEYHLQCRDSGGLSASDSLVVQVHPTDKPKYNVEFRMSLLTDYEKFVHSASLKKKFIEKIQELFGDKNTNNILLKTITRHTETFVVSWYNTSLVLDVCPRGEIRRLGSILVNSDRTIASRVQYIMDSDFPVSSIQMEDQGNCKRKPIDLPTDRSHPVPAAEETPSSQNNDEYLVTFIVPAIIIAAMLLLAGIFACVLYRRRRTGKMNVDEDGRATYGNKGIPVIFQEELEEKPESGTKTPIILKDEKPPLAPPEYSKSGSLKLVDDSEPYQPPPPMARMQENGRQARPKPTPTYRKPPPYVPP